MLPWQEKRRNAQYGPGPAGCPGRPWSGTQVGDQLGPHGVLQGRGLVVGRQRDRQRRRADGEPVDLVVSLPVYDERTALSDEVRTELLTDLRP